MEKVEAIKEVQKAVESAMHEVVSYLKSAESPTSERAHTIIDEVLEKYHCESPLGHIVAGGSQSVEPHNQGKGTLPKGEPIVIDIYPCSKQSGYCADMTRTVCIGSPSEEGAKMYDTLLEAQKLAFSMIKPGVKCADLHNEVDAFFKHEGYVTSGVGKEFKFKEGFVHSLGHGIGLNVHESPRIGIGSKDFLREGDVITIEPGLYYEGIGDIRIEDMVLVTEDG